MRQRDALGRFLPVVIVVATVVAVVERAVCPPVGTCRTPIGWLLRGRPWLFVRYGVLEPALAVAVLAGIGSLLVAGLQRRATHRHWLVRIWAVGTLLSLVVTSLVVRKCAIAVPAAAEEPFGPAATGEPFGCYTLLEYAQYDPWPFLRTNLVGTTLAAGLALALVGLRFGPFADIRDK